MNKLDKNAVKKKKQENNTEEVAVKNSENNIEETTENNSSVLDKLRKKKKEKKYRTSVYLKPEVFEKLITLNGETGESFTDIIEMLLEESLQDVTIKPRYVVAYQENLKRKQSKKDV